MPDPQRSEGWRDRPVCHITVREAGSLLLHWQCFQDRWLIQCPFGKREQQCSWSSMPWINFGTSCAVVVEIQILKQTWSFEQTEITRCVVILHLSAAGSDPVWLQSRLSADLCCFVARVEKTQRVMNCCMHHSACCLWDWAHVLYIKRFSNFWKHPLLSSNLNECFCSIFRPRCTPLPGFSFLLLWSYLGSVLSRDYPMVHLSVDP